MKPLLPSALRACLIGCLLAVFGTAPALGGTLSFGGYTTDGVQADGSIYFGIGAVDAPGELNLFQNSEVAPRVADYQMLASPPDDTPPSGTCGPFGRGTIVCGVAPAGGEPFYVRGSAGEDHFTEIGCSTARDADNTPCPRVFQVDLGGGNDYVKMWNFSVGLSDERAPGEEQRDWVTGWQAPMHGVTIAGGAGNDAIILAGGPTSGTIDGGPGDDQIFTKGGYSDPGQPVTGPYTIVCGEGHDIVDPGPGDTVGQDCEARYGEEEADDPVVERPEELKGYDIASTCGTARFDFHSVSGQRGAVRKGRRGCVFLVSNRVARQLLRMAYNSEGTMSDAFVKVLRVASEAAEQQHTSSATLEQWILDRLPPPPSAPGIKDVIQYALPDWIRRGQATAARANPLLLIGEAVGLTTIPLSALHRIHQIETRGACVQFTLGVRKGKAYIDSRIVYNPRYFDGRAGTYARVYERFTPRFLNLSCRKNGMVSTKHRRDTARVFRGVATTKS